MVVAHDSDKDHLIHQIGLLEKQIKNFERFNVNLSRSKAELVLRLSELEVDLKRTCEQNAKDLKLKLEELDKLRKVQLEKREGQAQEESLLAVELASTHEARTGIDRLRYMVEEKRKQFEANIIDHKQEVESIEANTFSLRMQLTEASRQKFRDVSNGLEAHTTAEMVETCRAASIRNTSLEKELLEHSEEVMDMMTDYDATEIKLVKMRRQRDFKRTALELVHRRLTSFSEKAMEYSTIVDETASQIVELQRGIQKAEVERAESITELRRRLIETKAEAVFTANVVNRRYQVLAQDPMLTRSGLLSHSNLSGGGLVEGDWNQGDVIYSQAEEVEREGSTVVDDIWNSSCVNMKDVSWS